MEQTKKTNFLGTKFLMDGLKKDKDRILKYTNVLKSYQLHSDVKDTIHKVYYDTPDFYLREHGIVVNKNDYKNNPNSELVVRYESTKERIQFLSDLPNTFAIKIPYKHSVLQHLDFVIYAIGELIPNGFGINMWDILNRIVPVIVIDKKRDIYRLVGISGFKSYLFFNESVMTSPFRPKKREKIAVFEVDCDTVEKNNEYDLLIKSLTFGNPQLIKLPQSDMLIGMDYLFGVKQQ